MPLQLAYIKALAALKGQQDALPLFVTQGGEDLGHVFPDRGDFLGVDFFHVDKNKRIDAIVKTDF